MRHTFRAGLLAMALWAATSKPAPAGEEVTDMEMSFAFRPGKIGLIGKWTLGRRHCPGRAPSVAPCWEDGRPGSFHWPSPEVGIAIFDAHLRAAEGRTVAEWVEATDTISPALADFMRRRDVAPLLPGMLEQAQAYAAAPVLAY